MDKIDENAKDYKKKEEYSKRFLILFCPLRLSKSLDENGSYQKALRTALVENCITSKSKQIADNIQNIHNSLASAMPENVLTATTDFIEADEVDENQEEDVGTSLEAMLMNIGSVLGAASCTGSPLQEEASELDLKFSKSTMEGNRFKAETVFSDMENVIEFSELQTEEEQKKDPSPSDARFCVQNSKLNSLVMQRHLTSTNSLAQETENQSERTEKNVDAIGTWESIVAWGKVEKLDDEQQVAYEILAATYVLSFHDDKTIDEPDSNALKDQCRMLCKFARRNTASSDPLCMFITGLGGAGKCKFTHEKVTRK